MTPAWSAAILVSVFLTTANVAFPSSDLRSSASWVTVSPRYSVSSAPDDSWNRSVSSATAATLSALAMGLPSFRDGRPGISGVGEGGPHAKRPGAQAHGASGQPGGAGQS